MNQDSRFLLEKLSLYLNDYSKEIKEEDIDGLLDVVSNKKEAFMFMLGSIFGLDIDGKDKDFFYTYFPKMIKHLDIKDYINNPYLKNIKINPSKNANWEIKLDKYEPYEAFVCDDFINFKDNPLPQIGFFDKEYSYPAVYQNDRLWMSIIPNEINTMKNDIEASTGNVMVCGLGLGYFPYMISLKDEVTKITIVEKDEKVISLFNELILPQFENKDKIKILNKDAFEVLESDLDEFDSIYIDLWHDVSDGLPMYNKLSELRKKYKTKKIMFWIEKTMKYYVK